MGSVLSCAIGMQEQVVVMFSHDLSEGVEQCDGG